MNKKTFCILMISLLGAPAAFADYVEAINAGDVIVEYNLKTSDAGHSHLRGDIDLRFFDHDGKPVPVSNVSLDPRMVRMGHSAGKPPMLTAVHAEADGAAAEWISNDVYFTMKGFWRLTVHFQCATSNDDQARIIVKAK